MASGAVAFHALGLKSLAAQAGGVTAKLERVERAATVKAVEEVA